MEFNLNQNGGLQVEQFVKIYFLFVRHTIYIESQSNAKTGKLDEQKSHQAQPNNFKCGKIQQCNRVCQKQMQQNGMKFKKAYVLNKNW